VDSLPGSGESCEFPSQPKFWHHTIHVLQTSLV